MNKKLPKIIAIVGPTASGKTELGLALAKKFSGEIISADSRQVYKKMNIGTAKPKGKWTKESYVVDGVPHYMMDMVEPDKDFTLADFKGQAIKHIQDTLQRNKLPIIVGGTGLYMWAIIDNLDIPHVKPDLQLRKNLEEKTLAELVIMLQKTDPGSADKIDLKNPRRILRALEVAITSGESFFAQRTKSNPMFEVLQIGTLVPKEELNNRIDARVDKQIEEGLVEETKNLAQLGYDWNLPSMSGIGYRQIGYYIKGEMTMAEAIATLKKDTKRYAKRQMTWFKRDKRIEWIKSTDLDTASNLVKDFLQK